MYNRLLLSSLMNVELNSDALSCNYHLDEKIAEMERHLKTLSDKLKQMKAAKKKEKVDKKSAKTTQDKPPKPKTASKTPAKAPAKTTPPKVSAAGGKKAPVKRSRPVYSSEESSSEDDVPTITFEQKKELSDSINKFEGEKLANVVQIIHSSMPHLRDVSCLMHFHHSASGAIGYCELTCWTLPSIFCIFVEWRPRGD